MIVFSSDSGLAPYRALAAAIVWRAVQDAFCQHHKTCENQSSCDSCHREALAWLLSSDGLDMINIAGLNGYVVQVKLNEFQDVGVCIRTHRGGKGRGVRISIVKSSCEQGIHLTYNDT